jgi:hypothetical protein
MKKFPILHPFLAALGPLVFLYFYNIDEVSPKELLWPAILALSMSGLIWFALSRILKDRLRAALLTSFLCIWFLSFGHLENALVPTLEQHFGHAYRMLILLYGALLIVPVVVLLRLRRGLGKLNGMANVLAIGLLAWNLLGGVVGQIQSAHTNQALPAALQVAQRRLPAQELPDIYFIIVDGYGRPDMLQNMYKLDSREFTGYLQQQGFTVLHNSTANYGQTLLALGSTLNLDYIDRIGVHLDPSATNRKLLARLVLDNRAFRILRQHGYRIVAFSSGNTSTEMRHVDKYINTVSGPTAFHQLLFFNTPLPFIVGRIWKERFNAAAIRVQKTKYTFKHLTDIGKMSAPKLVFAHILCPHPPFMVDAQGNMLPKPIGGIPGALTDGSHFKGTRQEYIDGYAGQVRFVNNEIRRMVEGILTQARRPAVIVIEGDHGPGSQLDWENPQKTFMPERFSNLIVMRLPGQPPPPDNLSSVNIFRLIFNRYLGADLPLLKNESYYSTWSHPCRFQRVTDQVQATATAQALASRDKALRPDNAR